MASRGEQKLPLSSLTAMVIGSMVGAGIFNLPGRFATATGPFGALIAWAIAGTGMYMLARVFQALAQKRPDIDNGVFAYAKAGFGDYVGFLSAFGYWISALPWEHLLLGAHRHDARPVLSRTLRGRHQRVFDHRVADRRLGLPFHDPARRQGGDFHQHDRHHRQGRSADPRGPPLHFLLQLFAILGEFLRRRRHAGEEPGHAGARHHADHGLRLPRH